MQMNLTEPQIAEAGLQLVRSIEIMAERRHFSPADLLAVVNLAQAEIATRRLGKQGTVAFLKQHARNYERASILERS